MMHKIGIVGLGSMGLNHLRVVNKLNNCELIGFYDVNKNVVGLNVKRYNNLDSLIDDCEIVIIATSTDSHFDVFSKCIVKEKHVLIEKPLTIKYEELQSIIKKVNKSKQFYKIGLLEKYNPVIGFITNLKLKNIKHIYFNRLSPINQKNRNKDNILLDLTIHDFSILYRILGDKLNSFKFHFNFHPNHSSDHVNIIGLSKRFNITMNTSKLHQKKVRNLEIITKNSSVYANLVNNSVEINSLEDASFYNKQDSYGHIEKTTTSYPTIEYIEPLLTQLKNFLTQIEENNFIHNREEFLNDIKLHKFLIKKIKSD